MIFDLDGIVTDTASIHQAAWASLFDDYLARRPDHANEDHSPFTADDYRLLVDGKPRYDGVSDFLASRGVSLPSGVPSDTTDDSVRGLGNRKQVAVRPERCVVVEDADAGVAAGRSGGFALVIGVDRTGHGCG